MIILLIAYAVIKSISHINAERLIYSKSINDIDICEIENDGIIYVYVHTNGRQLAGVIRKPNIDEPDVSLYYSVNLFEYQKDQNIGIKKFVKQDSQWVEDNGFNQTTSTYARDAKGTFQAAISEIIPLLNGSLRVKYPDNTPDTTKCGKGISDRFKRQWIKLHGQAEEVKFKPFKNLLK